MSEINLESLIELYKKKKILVVYGGFSDERAISIKTGEAVLASFRRLGMDAVGYDLDEKFFQYLTNNKPDLVYIALHGKFGEDGTIQGALEILGIPYTGPGVLSSAIAMDKYFSKQMFRANSINTAPFLRFSRRELMEYKENIIKGLSYPCVLKAASQGSALGVYIVNNETECGSALDELVRFDDYFLIEAYLKGREFTIGVIGDVVLPIVEIVPKNKFYDFESKYAKGMSEHIVPAKLDDDLSEELKDVAFSAHRSLGCVGVSRVDIIVDKNEVPWVLEVNTIPGMTETSLLPDAARAINISFDELVLRIMHYSLEKI